MENTFKLSNEELELRLKDFVAKEKFLLHIILDHIKEIDKRKLYLERAYSSLYEYLVKELGYSGSAAMRRQQAARLLNDIPELGQKIRSGSVNLSQIGELAAAIKKKEQLNYKKTKDKALSRISKVEKSNLLSVIENKSTTQTQKLIAQALDLPVLIHDKLIAQKDGSFRLELSLTQDQYELLLKSKDCASHKLQQEGEGTSWAAVFTLLAEQYVKNYEKPSTQEQQTKKIPTPNKNVTPKLRRKILDRDLHCQYKDPQTGKICGSTYQLQIDHKVPKWAESYSGSMNLHVPHNLQALCANHNKYKYQKESHMH